MKIRFLIIALSLVSISATQCNVSQKLKAASDKIAPLKNDIKTGKIANKCSTCKGGGGGGNGCSRCNKH